MRSSLFASDAAPRSVGYVSTRDHKGKDFIYDDEPELSGAVIPRVARPTANVVRQRRFVWNMLFVLIGVFGFFWQRSYYAWTDLLKHGKVVSAKVCSDSLNYTVDGKIPFFYQLPPEAGNKRVYRSVPRAQFYRMKTSAIFTYLPGTNGAVWQEGSISKAGRTRDSNAWLVSGFAVCSGWGLFLASRERRWRNQLHLLRQGVAVRGRVLKGSAAKMGLYAKYRVQYSYTAAGKQYQGRMNVTKAQYLQYTEENPYFTLFYDVTRPENHTPYCKIDSAKLVAAETK